MKLNQSTIAKLLAILLTTSISVNCYAEEPEEIEPIKDIPTLIESNRGWVSVGFFYPWISSEVRLDNDISGDGTDISLEDDLGLKDTLTQFSLEAGYYITPRLRVTAEFFELNRRSSKTITRDINWGDEQFEVGMTVGTFFNVEVYRIAIGYDLVRNEKTLLGLAVGTHALDASIGIGLLLEAEGNNAGLEKDASSGGLFPIPNIGGYWLHQISDRWLMNARLDWFGISVGEWDGDLLSASIGVRYYFNENWSAGLAAEYFNLKIDYNQTNWRGAAKLEYYGPKVQLSYSF
jgi:hypothetical protein